MNTLSIARHSLVSAVLAAVCASSAMAASATLGVDQAGQMVAAEALTRPGAAAFAYTRLKDGVQIRVGTTLKNVLFYGPDIVRVNANLGESHTKQPSITVVGQPEALTFDIKDARGQLAIASPTLQILIDKSTGALTFLRPDGSVITREHQQHPAEIKEVTIAGGPSYDVKQTFTLAPDESIYGLGLCGRPGMDRRGEDVLLVQTNVGIVVPMLLSTKSYGIMWDIYSKSTFKDDQNGATFWAESAPAGVDYYFIAGKDMDGVIAGYRRLTGAAPMFPKAAFGLFMSKERYQTQDRVIEVVRNFRKEQFPLDYIVQDWQYWGSDKDGTWSGMIWNKQRYPDPAAMTRTLHDELHTKLMISIWPSVGNDTELAHELDAKGLRFAPLHWISKKARIYDAYSADGRAIYFKHIKKGLLDVGVDALWMDGTEVEVGGACHNPVEVENDIKGLGRNAMGDFTTYLNPYSLLTTKGTYEGQRATSNKRVLTLTRSAWNGQQRYAALAWSGDTFASWRTLREQIPDGLNVCMAGQPYFTQDTGGFFVNFPGGEKNPEYRELFARWNQFAIFNPIYRIHGTNVEREPYVFKTLDPQVYKSLLDAAHLRYRLLPYIYGLAWMSTNQGYTMMRGLPMDFPSDLKVRKTDDVFMFGPAFLVHPVTRAMFNVSDPPATTIPPEALHTPDGKPGVAVEYFEGTNFEKPAGKLVDAKVDYTWPGPPLANPPAGLKGLNNFSGRWEGTITTPEEGAYEIGIEGDDGYRMWLDGKLVADDWLTGPKRYKGTKLTLRQGQQVPVKIEYFQAHLDRALRLSWRTPADLRALAVGKAKLNNTMDTYLPQGADWYDFWTNQRLAGGQTVKKDCPIDILPLYVRAGTILPMGPVVQYATERPDAPLEIRIYPGTDAQFTIYEDDNETYNYEKGQYATIPLRWDEREQTLTIGGRKGEFPGMVKDREMRILWMGPGRAAGVAAVEKPDVQVQYSGDELTVSRPK